MRVIEDCTVCARCKLSVEGWRHGPCAACGCSGATIFGTRNVAWEPIARLTMLRRGIPRDDVARWSCEQRRDSWHGQRANISGKVARLAKMLARGGDHPDAVRHALE